MTKADVSNLPVEKRAAIEARRAYQREWRAKNRDKIRAAEERYWAKKRCWRIQRAPQTRHKKHRLTCTTTSDGKEQPTNH